MEPAEFLLSERVPVVLNSVFVTLTFCSGLPLLLPIACASMLLTYWVDKSTLLRLYQKPPNMGEDLANVRGWGTLAVCCGACVRHGRVAPFVSSIDVAVLCTTSPFSRLRLGCAVTWQLPKQLLVWALLLHLAVAVWMYGNPSTLASGPVSLGSLAVNEVYNDYVSRSSSLDRLGVVPVLLRGTVVPVAVLFAVIVCSWLIKTFVAAPLGAAL